MRLTKESVNLLQLAAKRLEHSDCQRGCERYKDGQSPIYCPYLNVRDNGEIRCYGWLEAGEEW